MSLANARLRQPAEWAPHEWVWIGFPSHGDLWLEDLEPAREEVIAFARAVHAEGKGEQVRLVAADAEAADAARAMAGDGIIVDQVPFGDIWLRDTAPIVVAGDGIREGRDFGFNGWGGKYVLDHDDTVGMRLAERVTMPAQRCDWILEGGAIDVDGEGLAVTTEQCLLNPNRNPGLNRDEIEARLAEELGIDRILWLGEGLANDHTDGHVDNIARFVAPGTIAIAEPAEDDPNAAIWLDAAERARTFGLKVVAVPSPGAVEREGKIIPASYMNFYIGNATVVVPLYGAPNDDLAVERIGALFPGRKAVGFRADHILTGGGSFHCISQQVPRID